LPFVEAVVAVDRLANRGRFDPNLLLHLLVLHHGARGNSRVPEVLAYADRRSVVRTAENYRGVPYERGDRCTDAASSGGR
jgi:hypothetical protein